MSAVKLREAKGLVKKDKLNAGNSKRVLYSVETKKKILSLTKTLSNKTIVEELGVSHSFIEKLKRNFVADKTEEDHTPVQLFELPNSFMKEQMSDSAPIMRLTTSKGLSIEIFE